MAGQPGGGGEKVNVRVDDRTLTLSNLSKVLFPADGTTKAQVLDYYSRIAPALLPHLRDRPLTLKRYPNGVDGHMFFEKNAPAYRPDWVRTARLPSPGSTMNRDTIDYVVVDDLPTLVWVANLASIELHTPMWRVSGGGPDLMVADLDPGPPATVVECARVAMLLRDELGADLYVKTSGNKGLQVYTRAPGASGSTNGGSGRGADTSGRGRAAGTGRGRRGGTPATEADDGQDTRERMKEIAERLEKDHPDLVVSRMTKALRPGKVLVDWSQNHPAKTTVSVYSLRAREHPTVSTPLTWDEVEACRRPSDLVFTPSDVLERVDGHGDLFAPLVAD